MGLSDCPRRYPVSLRSRFITASDNSQNGQGRRVRGARQESAKEDHSRSRTLSVPLVQRTSCPLSSVLVVFNGGKAGASDTKHLVIVLAEVGRGRFGVWLTARMIP